MTLCSAISLSQKKKKKIESNSFLYFNLPYEEVLLPTSPFGCQLLDQKLACFTKLPCG